MSSKYYQELNNESKKRYEEKIKYCGSIDPYSNTVKYEDNILLWPAVTYPDIVNYLVFTTSYASGRQMKAYKSLESYNYFVSGWVRSITVKRVNVEEKERRLLFARVNHSQRASEVPLKTWVLIELDGEVVTGHCDCMAGLCEVCSHVGAVLFALEAGSRLRDSKTCTERSCQWILPTSLKQVPYVQIKDVDFTSAKRKKRDFDDGSNPPTSVRRLSTQPQVNPYEPTKEEKAKFFTAISESGCKSAILSVTPGFLDAFIPTQRLPTQLTALFNVDALQLKFNELIVKCRDLEKNIKVTEEMAINVEKITRGQASSKDWFAFRAGRITSSKMKSACHTDLSNPSLSLIKSICYPSNYQFTTEATKWGCEHENTAKELYYNLQITRHNNFSCRDGGLYLHPDFPYLGASPDGIVECTCCGKGVCEFKCPHCFKNETIENIAASKKSFLNRTQEGSLLDRKHAYYYQVQSQLLLCQGTYCDFVVFTTKQLNIERIYPDKVFTTSMIKKAHNFFQVGILPQLVAKWYTSQVLKPPTCSGEEETLLFCYCRKNDNTLKVTCMNEECTWKSFHLDCLGLKGVPKSKSWLCPTCRKMPHLKKTKKPVLVNRN